MVRYTLYQGKNFTGYSVKLESSINDILRPENGYYKFRSIIISAETKVTIFIGVKPIITIVNGTKSILKIHDIYEYVDISDTLCRIRSEYFKDPSQHYIKVHSTGLKDTLPCYSSMHSKGRKDNFDKTATVIVTILLFILFFGVVYSLATRNESLSLKEQFSRFRDVNLKPEDVYSSIL